MKKLIILTLLTMTSTAFAIDFNVQKFKEEAQERYVETLKDPDSAQFKDLYVIRSTHEDGKTKFAILCGKVNAKNSYGGYVGFKHFTVEAKVEGDVLRFFNERDGGMATGSVAAAVCNKSNLERVE